jgi:diguanylate cyclase (GGDEF)-like protein
MPSWPVASVVAFEAFADQIAGALKLLRTKDELEAARAELAQQKKDVEDANALLARAVENLHEVSTHDALTGIYTRRHFDHVLGIEWRRAARVKAPLSLLIGDIDGFKAYNDVLGHPAGDECLRRVAETIGKGVHRAGDVVARYGGEEFAVLLPETDAESAVQIGERIRSSIGDLRIHHPASSVGSTITISFGVASLVPDPSERAATLIVQQADHALYTAKRAGRNTVKLYTQGMEPAGKKYSAQGIDVYFEPRLCIHAEQCVRGAPAVFNPTLKPWIRPGNSAADELARVVETCPTGALHYVRRDGGAAEELPEEDVVMLTNGGPLYVRGDVTLRAADGTVVRRDTRMALCRCGLSENKPFCDNSHLLR